MSPSLPPSTYMSHTSYSAYPFTMLYPNDKDSDTHTAQAHNITLPYIIQNTLSHISPTRTVSLFLSLVPVIKCHNGIFNMQV